MALEEVFPPAHDISSRVLSATRRIPARARLSLERTVPGSDL